MDTEKVLFSLLRAEVCGGTVEENVKDSLSAEMLSSLYALSKKHDLAHIVGHALYKLGALREDEVSQRLKQASMQAVYRYARMDREFVCICKTLEEAKIPYIPLKGAVIRAYYPEPWMRTSCDIDILVNIESLDSASKVLQKELGYKYQTKTSHDISLYSSSGVHLELHYDLLDDPVFPARRMVLSGIWEYVSPVIGWMYRQEMPDETFYFYHIAHMAKHVERGGCGIKPLLDLWILNHKVEHDRAKREKLLAQGDLLTFARTAEGLAEIWFSGAEADPLTLQLERYILEGGVYGTLKNSVAVEQSQKGGKLRYALYIIFLPYDLMKLNYPILQKHKWLLPTLWVVRWFRAIFCGRAARSLRILKTNSSMTEDERANTAGLLEKLGL